LTALIVECRNLQCTRIDRNLSVRFYKVSQVFQNTLECSQNDVQTRMFHVQNFLETGNSFCIWNENFGICTEFFSKCNLFEQSKCKKSLYNRPNVLHTAESTAEPKLRDGCKLLKSSSSLNLNRFYY
jgi:hypothetical protein